MLTMEILHNDIAQMNVDRIVCPIHMDLTPAYEAGRQIFAAAGYDQLQKAIADISPKSCVSGFVAPACQLRGNALYLIKVQGDKEMHMLRWHESAIRSSLSSRKEETFAIPVLIDTEESDRVEQQWRRILHWILLYKENSAAVGKTFYLVPKNEKLCEAGRRVWAKMLLEEQNKMSLEQKRAFEQQIAEKNQILSEKNLIIAEQIHKIDELETLLKAQIQTRREHSPEDAQLLEQLDRKKLAESIELLCRVRNIPWKSGKEIEHGVWQLGYPCYPEGIFDIFQLMESDLHYRRNMDKIRMQKLRISELSLSQIKAYLTFLQRGERFCNGTIAEAVEDGRLLKLLLRIHDLINPYPW